ncbi:MAG TPA: hypothetical protein VJA94_09895 [Candidatus Angelobacter sp.]
MRSSKIILTLIYAFFLMIVSSHAQNKQPNAPSDKSITASGYVTAGVEAGCLMLQDTKTKTLYNLLFAGRKQPALGIAIQFTGKRHDGPTTCMQGEAVDVQKWAPLGIQKSKK